MNDNNIENQNNEGHQEIKALMYKEEDINIIVQMLLHAKADYDNLELFCMLKKVLLNPIPFGITPDNDTNK